METGAVYTATRLAVKDIRESCFFPAVDGWEVPTPDEIQLILVQAGWQANAAAGRLGVKDRTMRRWLSGDPIPFAAWCILAYQAGYGEIWKGNRPQSKV